MGGRNDCDENEYENLLYKKLKAEMLKLCDKHSNIIEFQKFKEKLELATSFDDLNKN